MTLCEKCAFDALIARLEALGFQEEHTGGTCTALVRRYDENYSCFITGEESLRAPTMAHAFVMVGFGYTDDDGGEDYLTSSEAPLRRLTLDKAVRLLEKISPAPPWRGADGCIACPVHCVDSDDA